ncbi:hypothetical protein GXW82_34640 [Streptacidiphilus sp. 4-A2]|nr:hypothetical protein [Streptacidiphilus sp. 4-A2]
MATLFVTLFSVVVAAIVSDVIFALSLPGGIEIADGIQTTLTFGPTALAVFSVSKSRKYRAPAASSALEALAAATTRLQEALTESNRLSEQVSAEIEAKSAALERARAEAEQWENLASLNAKEAAAVSRLVEARVEHGVRHLDRVGWLIGLLGWGVAVLLAVVGPDVPVIRHW